MRVVINAQLDPAFSGGIAQALSGLVHGLGSLSGSDEYLLVCTPKSAEWLSPYTGRNQAIHINRGRKLAPARGVRISDGFWESFSPDLLHFPYQAYTRTNVPTVFNPHDLQHVHLPECFSEAERERREVLYGAACRLATAVVTASTWVKNDVVRHFGIPAENVHVIPWGIPTAIHREADDRESGDVLQRLGLSCGFAIYPAQTWPHKNHLRLFDALHLVYERWGTRIPLVCSGAQTTHQDALHRRIRDLGLDQQVHFVGYVDPNDLRALYRSALFMIVPTLHEALSFPVHEAFAEHLSVACSNVTSLPEQVGDAALLFDPHDTHAIADAMNRLYRDEGLRTDLSARGARRLVGLSWGATAKRYRDLYHTLVGGQENSSAVSRKVASFSSPLSKGGLRGVAR